MPRGGLRPGAGRKKGKNTLTKEAARDVVRTLVIAQLGPLVDAQLANACGIKYLVTRDKKTGKFIRVGAAMAGKAGEETIEVWEKDPSVQAFTDLLNRAIDKPAEPVQELHLTGEVTIVARLASARHRLTGKAIDD